jgi:hypothetical protein
LGTCHLIIELKHPQFRRVMLWIRSMHFIAIHNNSRGACRGSQLGESSSYSLSISMAQSFSWTFWSPQANISPVFLLLDLCIWIVMQCHVFNLACTKSIPS